LVPGPLRTFKLTLLVAVGAADPLVSVGVSVGVSVSTGVAVSVGVGVSVAACGAVDRLKVVCAEVPPVARREITVAVPGVCHSLPEGIATLAVKLPCASAVAWAVAKLGICVCPGGSK